MTLEEWNVLVVEDEVDSRDLVQTILRFHGVSCTSAPDGEAALTILQDTLPTLILIDLALPGINGWELLHTIRQNSRLEAIPCVAITAYHSPSVANEALDAGFDAYFPKPIDAASFFKELEQLVNH